MEKLDELQRFKVKLIVDTSEERPVFLLIVGQNSTYIRLSPTSYYLLEQRSAGVSFESMSKVLSQQGNYISPAQVETAYQKVIRQVAKIERNPQLNPSGFFFRWVLIPKAIVAQIASILAIAFHRPIAYFLLAFIGAAVAIAPQQDLAVNITPTGFWWSYLLFLGSLLMHEFGHASACSRYGAKPSEIGFTVYLIWPAFYSDVSTAWTLKRWQRVIVDIGGVFFQLVIAAVYVIAYTFSNWEPLKLALVMIAGSCLLTLNPIFKFDGYWVLADALGVTNLGLQPLRIFRGFLNKLRGQPIQPLPWKPWVTFILSIYTVVTFGIWGCFFWVVLPMFWQSILTYPSLVIVLIPHLLEWTPLLDWKQLYSFLNSTFFVFIGLLMLFRLVKVLLLNICQKILPPS